MGMIAIVLDFVRTTRNGANVSDVKSDPGGRANTTPEHFSAPGDDSQPLPGDNDLIVETQRTGRGAVAGYADPTSEPVAGPGEVRRYARDSGGETVCEIHLKADGSIVLKNDEGQIELKSSGEVGINGATITKLGNVVTALGVNVDTHAHTSASPGSPTSAPIPG